MKFLADMGVSPRVVDWLRADSHDVVYLAEVGLQRLPDQEIFVMAASQERVLLTFDLDFGEIAARSQKRQPSVVVFRLANTRPTNVIGRLQTVLVEALAALHSGAIVLVEQSRIRIRKLPIGVNSGE